ncbi:hypothetical protein SAMN04515667_2028 [Formosa sp. Hel1_31_208]|uniref:hypothetical protein n=1 Tax=Formosa sp. Hel1_31_208 TaxID=1798225 RepID=UPI00087B95EB|nr:hypothetical protein [Formosa sp. Hel1_31_208]SDS37296.1 hypothetical protein SAMN04515667_2028 [Formosa sp. Hel1_31_208]
MIPLKVYKRKAFLRDVIIAVVIVTTPFLIYFHLVFPKSVIYESSFFTISSGYYENVQTMFWVFLMKISFVIIYTIWYITNKHWWKPIILIVLFISITQLVLALRDEIEYVDGNEFWIGPVVALPYILISIYISNKLDYYSRSKSLSEDLDQEIKLLFEEVSQVKSTDYKQVKAKVLKLRLEKSKMTTKQYLAQLIQLRDSLN